MSIMELYHENCMLVGGLINCLLLCDMFHQNPKQKQQDKRDLSRLDDNSNNDNPSNNSDILVHLSDIKGNISSIKTAIEDVL